GDFLKAGSVDIEPDKNVLSNTCVIQRHVWPVACEVINGRRAKQPTGSEELAELLHQLLLAEHVFKEHAGQVALTGVGQDNDYHLALHFRELRHSNRSGHGSTAGDPAKNAFLAHQPQSHALGFLVGHQLDAIDHAHIEVLGNETRTD